MGKDKTLIKTVGSKLLGHVNVRGYRVELRIHSIGGAGEIVCSYVELPGSKKFKESFLRHPTYRKEDIVGFDTAHAWNLKMTTAQKVINALNQVEKTIETYEKVMEGE